MTQRIPQETAEQLSVLWEREAAGLMRYAMVCTGRDQAASEDLVQRVFMAAAQRWVSIADRDAESRRNWLRRTCRNMWIDDIRRTGRLERLQADLRRLFTRNEPDPVDVVIARDDLDRCWRVIRDFPPVRRQVAVLYFVEQQSAQCIAALLGIRPAGVRKHVASAREALRRALGELCSEGMAELVRSREGEEERA